MSLTRLLDDRASPIARYLRARFPHTSDLQRRYREPIAYVAPLTPAGGTEVASGTIGDALNWRLRFLLTPQPDLTLAFKGAARLNETHRRLFRELLGAVGGGRLRLRPDPGRGEADPPIPADTPGPTGLEEERLVRCCFALALYTEVFRAGLLPGSRLLTLRRTATLEDLLALASEAEVADVLALTEVARRSLLPALAARGTPRYLGPDFTGSPDVGNADADVIAGGLLVECKVTLGRRRSDGRRYCSLDLITLHQLLGYLLLVYQDDYAIDTLGVYAARYAYLVTWPAAELLAELAGGPVDLAELRAGFREAAKRAARGRVGAPQSPVALGAAAVLGSRGHGLGSQLLGGGVQFLGVAARPKGGLLWLAAMASARERPPVPARRPVGCGQEPQGGLAGLLQPLGRPVSHRCQIEGADRWRTRGYGERLADWAP